MSTMFVFDKSQETDEHVVRRYLLTNVHLNCRRYLTRSTNPPACCLDLIRKALKFFWPSKGQRVLSDILLQVMKRKLTFTIKKAEMNLQRCI